MSNLELWKLSVAVLVSLLKKFLNQNTCGYSKNHLNEAVLLSNHNIYLT